MKKRSISLLAIPILAISLGLYAEDKPNDHLGAEFATKAGKDREVVGDEKAVRASRVLPLKGAWQCALDEQNAGVVESWFERPLNNARSIELPGTVAMAGMGSLNEEKSRFGLVPATKYVGKAWYQRESVVPEDWVNRRIAIRFERCGWESRLWIDGKAIGVRDSLCTPHVYNLTENLAPGRHRITVRMDSKGRPGASCHGWGSDTQIPWNGILGSMEMVARDVVYIGDVQVDAENKGEQGEARLTVQIVNESTETMDGDLKVSLRRKGVGEFLPRGEAHYKSGDPSMTLSLLAPIEKGLTAWDEFNPNLYELKLEAIAEGEKLKSYDQKVVQFGVRKLQGEGSALRVNGRRVFLRGTHDGCAFPMTGAMATSVEEWRRIFKVIKQYGLNHVRYHSVCPPEGAFQAADEEGVYLHSELPFWGHVRMDWAGAAFLRTEMDRILDAYGNHPSFCFFSMGNEHEGDWDLLGEFVRHAKHKDPRHLYATTSNAYVYPGSQKGFPCHPEDQFWTSMLGGIPKQGERKRVRYMERFANNEFAERDADYSDLFRGSPVPAFAHELGQYWVFPNLAEVKKYTGVMQARNFDIFRESLDKAGLLPQAEDFSRASGASAVVLYKEEIERELRTPECGGFQLLDLHDYPGQGTALVGLLDVFWESKGLIEPSAFRRFCDSTVLLSRIPKSIWSNQETARIPIELSHFGKNDLNAVKVTWTVKVSSGGLWKNGSLGSVPVVKTGTLTRIGAVEFPLASLPNAEELTLEARIDGTDIANDWRIWCYPAKVQAEPPPSELLIATRLDDAALRRMESGGTVVLLGHDTFAAAPVDAANAVWTPWQNGSIRTCGMLIQDKHPALREFPTSFHTDWQWWDLLEPYSRAFTIPKQGCVLTPIVQPIYEPIGALKLATLLEARVGKGKLLATSFDLVHDLDKRPGARQFRNSLIQYAQSPAFSPRETLSLGALSTIFNNPRFFVSEAMPEFGSRAVLDVRASVFAPVNAVSKWDAAYDQVLKQSPGFRWEFARPESARPGGPGDVSYTKLKEPSWMSAECRLKIHVPAGFSGRIYLYFHDIGEGKRLGVLGYGREVAYVGRHDGNGKWVGVNLNGDDTASGEVVLRIGKPTGGDSWSSSPTIERLAIVPNPQ